MKILALLIFILLIGNPILAEESKDKETAGELLGTPVPIGNYYFVKSALMIFGNKWGPQPTTPVELEDCVWEELMLSYEAFRRGIQVKREEVDQEITNTLQVEKLSFDWEKDKEAYAKWLKEKTNEPIELFENQIRHLIQLRYLRQQVMDSIQVTVTEEETYQEFLNEHNTLGIELIQFDDEKEAQGFYERAKNDPGFWDGEKQKSPERFKHPGFVALEFLMDMWKLPKTAVYEMMKMEVGEVYPPTPIYKGDGVFKVLEKRPADESRYRQLKYSYY